MSTEIVQIHVGQCGVQMANALWELYCLEHGILLDGEVCNLCPESFTNPLFSITPSGKAVPRVIMVDLEPTPIDEIRTGAYRQLFHPSCLITGKEDAASNFARGFFTVGREQIDVVMERVRQATENCNNLQAIFISRSYGGGTGSGFTTLLLERLLINYGKKAKVEFAIYPAPNLSPIIVEPYNAVFAAHESIETINASFIIDNEAVYDICANKFNVQQPTYTNLNRLIAQVVSASHSSLRYPNASPLSIDELQTNLVPYPRIHYPMISYSPLVGGAKTGFEGFTIGQITNECFEPASQMLKVDARLGAYLSCCFIYQGDVNAGDINNCVNALKTNRNLHFIEWSPSGFKIAINPVPPMAVVGGDLGPVPRSLCLLSNSSAIKTVWIRLLNKFDSMYKKRAFVHHYVGEGMEEGEFKNARDDIEALIQDYKELEDSTNGKKPEEDADEN
ncbi:tubulin alpha chain-like isoform X1 [Chrysoperla carnea]|uniref:tubulin alpha chain-like isoform X1 n=1 Tax=Chrysoperla carnea TaxID=189513 RepID=UPI001D063E50|nr:tubulin alpha chain-like isoform X1 [Chrysoperla carnea]